MIDKSTPRILAMAGYLAVLVPALAQDDLKLAPERLALQVTTDPAVKRCRRIEDPMPLMPVSLRRTFHDDFDEHPLSKGTWVSHYAGGASWPAARYWGGDGSPFKRETPRDGGHPIHVRPRHGGRATPPPRLDPVNIPTGVLSLRP